MTIQQFLDNPELIRKAHVAIENAVIDMRDSRISILNAGNGICCREKDGSPSSQIRIRIPDALRIGLEAVLTCLVVLVA